ncbi:MAG: FAD-binding oxidoreductase [Burkholderiaceae bacterium]|nr:FAD-binding oxidoreductase [Burkholderiaceae bacterium]
MRRWNGWGEEGISLTLNDAARAMLAQKLGEAQAPQDALREQLLARVPASRLPEHSAIARDADARLQVAYGESYADWLRKRMGALPVVPDGVAWPESSADVRALLDLAQREGWIVLPFAGGTSVAGHLDCPRSERPVLCLRLGRMNKLLHLDAQSQLATFGAGTPGPLVEAQLRALGYTLGHFPQSFEYSTLGGWVVTRSSGQQSLRYGRIEQLFAGGRLEAPAGRLDIPTFPASSAGPDLRELVMGSEGRLGVLTEAVVRVSKAPAHESFHAVFFPDWDIAEAAVRSLVQRRLPLSMLRLSNAEETASNLVLAGHAGMIAMLERYLGWRGCGQGKCLLMLGVTGEARAARQTLKEARRHVRPFGAVYIGTAMGSKWQANRFMGPYLRNTLWESGYAADTIETAADWPRVKDCMLAMEQAAAQAFADFGERVHAFTHLSHVYPQGSSVYSTFIYRVAPGGLEPNLARWQHFKRKVSEAIVAAGGTISHQHGVGRDHAPYLAAEKSALGVAALAALCRQFDPQGLMNPGALLQTAEAAGSEA